MASNIENLNATPRALRVSEFSYARRKREGGVALVIAMFLLVMMSLVGVYALDTVALDQQVAGFQNRKKLAFYAAEAAAAEALSTLAVSGTPDVSSFSMGDSSLYPYGQPTYGLDSTAANPVEPLAAGAMDGMNLAIGQGGSSKFNLQTWKVRVEGNAPGGSVSRIEFAAQRFIGN